MQLLLNSQRLRPFNRFWRLGAIGSRPSPMTMQLPRRNMAKCEDCKVTI